MTEMNFSDSDSAIYSWGSENEVPRYKCFSPLLIHSMYGKEEAVIKFIFRDTQNIEQPSVGSEVQVTQLCGNDQIARILSQNQLQEDFCLAMTDGTSILRAVLGRGMFPYGLELGINSMRKNEISLIVFSRNSVYEEEPEHVGQNAVSLEDVSYPKLHKFKRKKGKETLKKWKSSSRELLEEPINLIDKINEVFSFPHIYLIELVEIDSITEVKKNVSKRVLKGVSPYHQLFMKDFHITMDWHVITEGEKNEEPHTFSGILSTDDRTAKHFKDVLMTMREGEVAQVIFRGEAAQSFGEDFHISPVENNLIVNLSLRKILRRETLVITRTNGLGEIKLHVEELISQQKGIKQQMEFQDGCNVAATIVFKIIEKQFQRQVKTIFPFCSEESVQSSFAIWTLGYGEVPLWIEELMKAMKPRQKLRVKLPWKLVLNPVNCSSLWHIKHPQCNKELGNECNREALLPWKFSMLLHDGFQEKDNEVCGRLIDAVETLSCLIKWDPFDGRIESQKKIRNWLKKHSVIGDWKDSLFEEIKSSLLSLRKLPGASPKLAPEILDEMCSNFEFYLEVQAMDILSRENEDWLLSGEEKLLKAKQLKEFANFLLKGSASEAALLFYQKAFSLCEKLRTEPSGLEAKGFRISTPELPQAETLVLETGKLSKAIQSNMSLVFSKLGRWKEVVESASAAIECDKTDLKVHYRLALANLKLENYEKCQAQIANCEALAKEDDRAAVQTLKRQLNRELGVKREQEKRLFQKCFSSLNAS